MKSKIALALGLGLLVAAPSAAAKLDYYNTWEECITTAQAMDQWSNGSFICVQAADGKWFASWQREKRKPR